MKKLLFIISIFVSFNVNAQTNKDFNFLLGNWELNNTKGKITESWAVKNKVLTGVSYHHNLKGDSTLSETMQIRKIKGSWSYCVKLNDPKATEEIIFTQISNNKKNIKFENKANDFPKIITYINKGQKALFASIEGPLKGENKKIDFNYKRRE